LTASKPIERSQEVSAKLFLDEIENIPVGPASKAVELWATASS
jgi:hypothetical protein